jgi:hypothetical protein
MRKIHTAALALFGLVLGAASLTLATAASNPSPVLVRRAVVPAVAGDDSVPSNSTAGATATATPSPTPLAGACAGIRTPVKVLSDAAANFDRTPHSTSMFSLLMKERPAGIIDTTPRRSDESSVIELAATILGFRRTNGGGIELVIAQSPSGDPMVASFPPPGCLNDTPIADRAALNSARIAVQQACGVPADSGSFKPLGGKATLRGVPFWGPKHTDMSGAVNGIELGPVLSFQMDDGETCSATSNLTPTPTPTVVVTAVLTSVSPQTAAPGEQVLITISVAPQTPGKFCGYQIWDAGSHLISEADLVATDAQGHITWHVTLPQDIDIGDASVQPICPGLPTKGSARLAIHP